jgi:DNA-binding beta-propeller fold protein YncE
MKTKRLANSRKLIKAILIAAIAVSPGTAGAQQKAPLKLIKSVPLPALKDGDFDHFTADVEGKRLFAAAEENSKLLVFNLDSGELLQTVSDLKAPHSIVYRNDLKKLFVVDGDLGKIRMYDASGAMLKNAGDIDAGDGADSMGYDPATKYMYVITGGSDAKLPNSYLTTVDTTSGKVLNKIKIDSNDVEAVVLEKSGPRVFVVIRGNNTVEVFDRQKQTLLATWPLVKDATKPTAMAYDEAAHRLFIGTRNPGKLVVVDSASGQVVASQPGAAMIDDMGYDKAHKLIFFAATEFLDVFQMRDADHYDLVSHFPTAFRAKTGLFVPELNRYYLGVPHHETKSAELRIYEVTP